MSDDFDRIVLAAYKELNNRIFNLVLKAGETMKTEARDKVTVNESYVTGGLRDSIYSRVYFDNGDIVLELGANAKADGNDYPYPAVVEYGREAGKKMPPVRAIKDWLYEKARIKGQMVFNFEKKSVIVRGRSKKKFQSAQAALMLDREMTSLAFIIGKKIAKNGLKPKPFLTPAFELGVDELIKEFAN